MRILLKYTFTIILLIVVISVKAELTKNLFDLRHIGYAEGLNSLRVFSIVEDSSGAIWIATKEGIGRYNGHAVKNYTLSGNFHYSDMAGRTLRLLYNEQYGLWAYDNTGRIYLYSVKNDSFEQYLNLGQYINGEIILNKLCLDGKGTLWFGLSKGLYKKEADKPITSIIEGEYINDIISSGQQLFVGTSMGVFQLSPSQSDKIHRLIKGKDVQTLFYNTTKNELWLGTFNNGLWVMDLNTSALLPMKERNLSFLHPIRAIIKYDAHTLLVGIDGGGVYTVDQNSKKCHLLMSTEDSTDIFLRGNGIYAVTKDNQGNIWIGSYTGGVSVAILQTYPITILNHQRGNPQSLANNNINDIEEDTNGNQWFATDFGISVRDTLSNKWSHGLKGVVVVTLCKGENGSVWAGTYGDGLYLLNNRKQIIRHLTKKEGLTTNYIFSIKQDTDGNLWVAGLEGKLQMLSKQGIPKQSYDIQWIHSIEVVGEDRIAAATVNGFYMVNKRSGAIQHYATSQEYSQQSASAYIISMLFNADSTVWLGTEGGGLNLYDMKTRKLKMFTTNEGMPSNDIYSLQRDIRGRLWASTGKGLALIENSQVSNLNYVGDVDREYNKSSFARLANGKFVYGSTNGAVLVTPDAITVTNYQSQLKITGLSIEYLPADEEKRLRPTIYNMLERGMVELDYEHNSFSVTFESINYRFQRDIAYQYILEGYEKSWSSLSSNGMVRYTNVSPGSYILKVHSLRRNNGKVISEQTLMLTVAQPWWNSWWAWIVYFSIVGFVFHFILRYKRNQLQKEYDEDKIRFFINTAHDIRTPVTLIMAPLDDLSKEEGLSDKALYFLKLARNSTHKLYSLISQLLEFEKMDSHKQQLTLSPLNINNILTEEISSFQPLCNKKQLNLNFNIPDEEIFIMADRQILEILLDNLVSNACKYTMPGGNVSLSLNYTKRKVIIEIKDSGIGIPKKAKKYLFSDVYRANNTWKTNEDGTGFGLLQVHRIIKILRGKITFQSEENKGSTFIVTLKRTYSVPESISKRTIPQKKILYSETSDITKQEDNKSKNQGRQEGKNTILIVEDHESLRDYLRKTFEYDYRVVDVSDGQDALSYLSTEYPDLILSDVMMPGLQGDELCRLVKENPNTSGIPFILLTAKVNHDATVNGLKKGADDYIPKPFNTEILKLKVQSMIANRNRQKDYFMRQAIMQVETKKDQVDNEETESPTSSINNNKIDDSEMSLLSESDRQFIIQATQLVIRNISNIEINTLCKEMAMSRTLFYSRLKSLTGKGPQEFIRIIRLQKASELLKEGKSVTEVATDTGFVNVKYFSSLFKKHFGIQPSKFNHTD